MFARDISRVSRGGSRRPAASPRRDQRMFSRTASRIRNENMNRNPMRGGIRL